MAQTAAERQKAFRDRRRETNRIRAEIGFGPVVPAPTPAFQYRAWRATIAAANAALDRVYEEVNVFMQERSERWQASDRALELQADYERLEAVLESLAELEALAPSGAA